MNRRLHNTILAFSISSGFLMLGLMAAAPLPPQQSALQATALARADAALPARIATERSIEARTRDYETQMARAASTGEMIALSSDFLAAVAAEAAVAAILQEADAPASEPRARAATAERPRGDGRRRRALAMPYFSFAQGLRGGGS
ncbi:hypothetical protein H0E84_06110 [Luteimonas sp. SJ-92]|uniref:Uncharacterized protein n=1 Tax=Luteimonas salinisoli TaxID=2752307 RepID=A0A853J9W9_9GAMM|nr:hypothetical protein [Luteimonas salinisoli]NZA25953.1 hypothetical protein [Luteimonas salinisoli]